MSRPGEEVVAQVELGEILQVPECVRDDTREAVAVEVDEHEVGEEGDGGRERALQAGVVEVDARDHRARRRRADHARCPVPAATTATSYSA
jgi:hypothetical protein